MTIIYPPDISDGSFLNWERWDMRVGGSVDITDEQPRSGNGSLEFNLLTGTAKAGLNLDFAAGDDSHKLADLTEASYDWYRDASSTNPPLQHPSLKLVVDGDGNLATTSDRVTMAYEEAYNSGSVPTNSWQHSSSTTTTGNWWVFHSTGSGYPNAPGVVEVYNKTLADWMSQSVTYGAWTDPIGANAVVLSVRVEAGSGWNGVSKMFVDNINVSFGNASDVLANFEVLPPLPDCAPDVLDSMLATLGTPGDDTMIGGAGTDFFRGLDGYDRLEGKGGADYLFGEGDRDTLYGGAGKDFLDGGAGADFVYGDAGDDTMKGDSCEDVGGKDRMYGGAGDDDIDGDGGNDTLWGGDGNDRIYGDVGNDTAYGGANNDTLNGDDGDDVLLGEAGNDTAYGGDDDDSLNGGDGNDKLFGGDGEDSIGGGAGNDSLSGGDDDDVLDGDAGFDFYTGGGGDDRFLFDVAGTPAAPEEDAITDFTFGLIGEGKDVIDLRAFDAQLVSTTQLTVVNEGAVSGLGSNVKTIYVDLQNDGAGNNLTHSEIVIYVNAGLGGFVRNFIIAEGNNPNADILI